jgi:hypothetical protein
MTIEHDEHDDLTINHNDKLYVECFNLFLFLYFPCLYIGALPRASEQYFRAHCLLCDGLLAGGAIGTTVAIGISI